MVFLWSCFLLFGKVIIGSLLWLMGLSVICIIIGIIAFSIGEINTKLKKRKPPPEPPAISKGLKGVESEGTDFTWH